MPHLLESRLWRNHLGEIHPVGDEDYDGDSDEDSDEESSGDSNGYNSDNNMVNSRSILGGSAPLLDSSEPSGQEEDLTHGERALLSIPGLKCSGEGNLVDKIDAIDLPDGYPKPGKIHPPKVTSTLVRPAAPKSLGTPPQFPVAPPQPRTMATIQEEERKTNQSLPVGSLPVTPHSEVPQLSSPAEVRPAILALALAASPAQTPAATLPPAPTAPPAPFVAPPEQFQAGCLPSTPRITSKES